MKYFEVLSRLGDCLARSSGEKSAASDLSDEGGFAERDIALSEHGLSEKRVMELLVDISRRVPRTHGKGFWNQLFGGRSAAPFAAECISAFTNNSMYTHKVGGAYIKIEEEVLQRTAQFLRLVDFEASVTPGGSLSNFLAICLARDEGLERVPDAVIGDLVFYTSEESHYSVGKGVRMAGLRSEQLQKIEVDERGHIVCAELEKRIRSDRAAGRLPAALIATAGTTVLGAFDDIDACSRICERENLWLHVDAAWGGPAAFAPRYAKRLKGVEKATSITWDAHKLIGVPLTASMLFVQRNGALKQLLSESADYLFQMDRGRNPGVTSMQCGRRNDMLKVWAQWKYLGDRGLEERISRLFALRDYALASVRSNEDLHLVLEPEFLNLCFTVSGAETESLCAELDAEGVKVSWGSFRDEKFVRLVFVDPEKTKKDIDEFFSAVLRVRSSLRKDLAERTDMRKAV